MEDETSTVTENDPLEEPVTVGDAVKDHVVVNESVSLISSLAESVMVSVTDRMSL